MNHERAKLGYLYFLRKQTFIFFTKKLKIKFMWKRKMIRDIEAELRDNPFEEAIATKIARYESTFEPISDDDCDFANKSSIYEAISDDEIEVVYSSSDFADNSKVYTVICRNKTPPLPADFARKGVLFPHFSLLRVISSRSNMNVK